MEQAAHHLYLLVFTLGAQRYALELEWVTRVVRAAFVTPLPRAPDVVMGVVDIEGSILPVVNVRKRFRLPEREVSPEDDFIIARTPRRQVVMVADAVEDVMSVDRDQVIAATAVVPGAEYLRGVVKMSDGLVLLHDIDAFLSLDEERVLTAALENAGG